MMKSVLRPMVVYPTHSANRVANSCGNTSIPTTTIVEIQRITTAPPRAGPRQDIRCPVAGRGPRHTPTTPPAEFFEMLSAAACADRRLQGDRPGRFEPARIVRDHDGRHGRTTGGFLAGSAQVL